MWITFPEPKDAIEKARQTNKGQRRSPRTEFKKGQIPWNKGRTYSEETRKKISEAKKKAWIDGVYMNRKPRQRKRNVF